ncbi:B3 domain-containing transcription factor VRN1-like [Vicia villosa]|uniref:B3 domain-containing transcription factor VRN1-like n=1 Tax=Vicia villosa TaxID=3911 RepID=UPI00273B1380|nr:B3 domain-containing transcription factor VRN1-like [Vicia villosa]
MARENSTIPICFFKIILQTNLQTIKIPNKFTRSHGAGLPNPVMMKPPDGTKWKVFWKNINGEIWFQKGWSIFTQNYSLQHGCLVVFKYYKEGSSELDVIILDQHAVEIDYDSSCDTFNDEDENLDHIDDESVEILNDKKARQKSPLVSPRPHKKVRGDIKETSGRTTSMNSPKGNRAQEVAARFITSNPFFTILIKPNHLTDYQLTVPNLKGVIENKENYVTLKIGKRSWNVKLLRVSLLTAGWSLFASESGLQSGDVCVFEQINKQDLVFKVHVFSGKSNLSV